MKYFVILLLLLVHPCTSDNRSEVVNLDHLPEAFSSDILPRKSADASQCFPHIGCMERIPKIPPRLTDPLEMGTRMILDTAKGKSVIPYERVNSCLSDGKICEQYPYSLAKLIESGFNPKHRTIIVIHGYMSECTTTWQDVIYQKWSKLDKNANIIRVCWSKGNHVSYGQATGGTQIVGRQITVFLYYLAAIHGRSYLEDSFGRKIFLVGHSLGAHIAGFVGKDSGGKIGRITGLDPAGPNFERLQRKFRLDRTDAIMVDVIHTNVGRLAISDLCFGASYNGGHVDYYANDGKNQPGCKDTGTSHKIAPEYYISGLEQQLYLRETLNNKQQPSDRLFAYKSHSYESFKNGTSLSQYCPKTILDDDLEYIDINKCAVPIDFTSFGTEFRKELHEKYDIDFGPDSITNRKYFFFTKPSHPYLNNHNLIKIRISKEENLSGKSKLSTECNIMIELKFQDVLKTTLQLERYELIERYDHFEVLVPYLLHDDLSQYSLAQLDLNNFYIEQTGHNSLLEKVGLYFPSSMRILGLGKRTPKSNVKRITSTIKSAINGLFGRNTEDTTDDKTGGCDLNIDTVVIQPLKKLTRHISVSYTSHGFAKRTDVRVLKEGEVAPKIEAIESIPSKPDYNTRKIIDDRSPKNTDPDDLDENDNSQIYIDTVIIGPGDIVNPVSPNSGDEVTTAETGCDEDDDDDDNEATTNEPLEHQDIQPDSSNISPKIWFFLTLVLTASIIYGGIFVYKRLFYGSKQDDERELIYVDNLDPFAL